MPGKELSTLSIVLASASPRRSELLAGLDLNFRQVSLDYDEETDGRGSPEEIARELSERKAEMAVKLLLPGEIGISADTIVCIDNRLLGKPGSREEAVEMLRLLSGREHTVTTGVTIFNAARMSSFTCTTVVSFARLSEDEISYYLDNYRPYDKAGAYGIQEWIGSVGVEAIRGSYFNVMGLPVQKLYRELKHFINEI